MRGAFKKQEGGKHYKGLKIQPVEYILKNGIGFMEGNAIKYLTRWRDKGGIEDLKKAKHYVEMLIEFEGEKLSPTKVKGHKKVQDRKFVPFLERRRRKLRAARRKQQRESEARYMAKRPKPRPRGARP